MTNAGREANLIRALLTVNAFELGGMAAMFVSRDAVDAARVLIAAAAKHEIDAAWNDIYSRMGIQRSR